MLRRLLRFSKAAIMTMLGGIAAVCIVLLAVFGLLKWYDMWRTSDWIVVDGIITRLATGSHGRGESQVPESQGCCLVLCDYTYGFGETTYTNDKVTGVWFDALSCESPEYLVLKQCQERGEHIQVWVNPEEPAESVLFRTELAAEMFFGPALAALFLIAWAMSAVVRRERRLAEQAAGHSRE